MTVAVNQLVMSYRRIQVDFLFQPKERIRNTILPGANFQNAIQYFPLEQKGLRKNSPEKNTIIWTA